VAALLCAFYPKFPTHSCDNRYHLQAFRHLYVLAVEPRVLVPRSSDSGEIMRCEVEVQWADQPQCANQPQFSGLRLETRGPVLLPALSLLSSVSVSDSSYWSTVFRRSDSRGWQAFTDLLHSGGDLTVKKKPGARLSPSLQWSLGSDQLRQLQLSSEQSQTFLSLYLADCPKHWEASLQCLLSACLATSTPGLLSVWTSLLSPQATLHTSHSSLLAADILSIINIARHFKGPGSLSSHQTELALSLCQSLSQSRGELSSLLREYLAGQAPLHLQSTSTRQLLASSLTLNSLPSTRQDLSVRHNPLRLSGLLRNSLTPASLFRIIQ